MDIRTLYLCSGLVTVLLTFGMLSLACWRPRARYVIYWAIANGFFTLGTLGVVLRGEIPAWLAIPLSNIPNYLAMYLWLEGFQTLAGTRRFTQPARLVVLIGSLATLYFWAWDDNVTDRIIVGSGFSAVLLAFTTATLLQSRVEGVRFPLLVSAALFGGCGVLSVGRALYTLLSPSIVDYMAAPPLQALFLIPYTLSFVALNFTFLWLVIAHDAVQHAKAQTALLTQVEATSAALAAQAADLRRAKAEAEAASATKSTFLATMSHEIRTPLNGVIGFADLLLGTGLDRKQRRYVELQREAGHNLLTVINDILDFSKLEAGKFEIEPVDVDVWALVDSSLGLFRPAAADKSLELRLVLDSAVPRWAHLDGQRLRQALTNLLSNAIKFTRVGNVTLMVRLLPTPDRYRFEVRDTGIGIPADKQHKLFQDFSQVDGSISREFGGTGLGLAISRQLVHLLDGELGVETEPGVGSNFWIELPYRPPQDDHTEALSPVHRSLQQGGLHILVAEDAPINQEIIGLLLKRFGHQAVLVGDGAAAVEAAAQQPFDLVLMDLHMPIMDGLEAARRIRFLPGAAGRLPIVALTGSVMAEEIEQCRVAGMQGHLAKPIDPDKLMETIDRLTTDAILTEA
ncbi:MAG TPA: ATP-binding protein [Aliidongia sp.]|nr:ATP-binding protein [Aliidongia sp.]